MNAGWRLDLQGRKRDRVRTPGLCAHLVRRDMVPAPERGPLTIDLDVDVCVIGGGLAGLTAARELARRGWSVAVLEAAAIAWNASGRNTGFVLPGFAASMDRVIARVGLDHAKALWALSEAGRRLCAHAPSAIPDARRRSGRRGWLKVSKIGRRRQTIWRTVRSDRPGLGAEVEAWPTERVRAVLKSDHYFHALHFPRAFHIHPLNYALGLAAAAEAAGARIFEETPALSIDAGRRAQAHRHADRRGCAPATWCSPAMCISAS